VSASPRDAAQAAAASARRAERAEAAGRWFIAVLLVVGALAMLVPFYVMLAMSFKTMSEIDRTSVWAWPVEFTWENFRLVLTNPNVSFVKFLRNSTVIAVVSTAGVIVSSSLVAYAFARLRFRGRNRLFVLLLSTMMLPGIVTMIPTFVLYKYLYWIDTFMPLTVPAWFGGGAYNIFLLRQFFMGLPRELDEAALIDGASHATIFWRIVMPLSGPALATVGVFSFIYNWRDFMGPLLYLNSPEKQTLELGLRTYSALNGERWDLVMAASVLVMIPLLVIFAVGQKYFVKGIAMSGLK
jgi:ABC-type glycerol-3-phosphate transport system permease component